MKSIEKTPAMQTILAEKVVITMKRSFFKHSSLFIKAVNNGSGFTLLELTVVIAIFVALLAVAIPNFEGMLYGSGSNRALLELSNALQDARLKAIKTHQPATVAFNQAANQLTITWLENNANRQLVHPLSSDATRVTFDNAPPGGVPAPDNNFTFSELGFIIPAGGNPTSNIYIIDNTNGRRFHIAATVGGGIIERQWNGSAWTGPILSDPAPGP